MMYLFLLFLFFFFNLWWILSYIEMKQPWVYMCSPSRPPLPPPSPPAPFRFSQNGYGIFTEIILQKEAKNVVVKFGTLSWSAKLGEHWGHIYLQEKGLPGSSVLKNLPTKAGDVGSIPGLGRSHREGNGNPLQYSSWEIP